MQFSHVCVRVMVVIEAANILAYTITRSIIMRHKGSNKMLEHGRIVELLAMLSALLDRLTYSQFLLTRVTYLVSTKDESSAWLQMSSFVTAPNYNKKGGRRVPSNSRHERPP